MRLTRRQLGLVGLANWATKFAAKANWPRLLLAEYGENHSKAQTQTLVVYSIVSGDVSRQLISTSKTDEVRFDLGENLIHRGRYVALAWMLSADIFRPLTPQPGAATVYLECLGEKSASGCRSCRAR